MFSYWQKPRERFSLEELRHLNDVIQRHSVITDLNKDAIVETLRSIAELMIWGDQHEPAFFEYFVEHGLFAHVVHILSVSNKSSSCGVTVQLLQTLNIMLQNIKSEKAIFYLFSKEHINNVITFPFDFSDEELLAYYISFLKVISMKLDKSTITYFLVDKPDGSLAFPLYTEAIRFFHHEESMVRIAVRTISLTVYHVQDGRVSQFVLSASAIRYFEDLAIFIRQQSFTLARLVSNAAKNFASVVDVGRVEASIAEIGDLLYYCNDVMNTGIAELSEVMSEHLASIWLFPVLLTSLTQEEDGDSPDAKRISPLCSMYLLSRVFHVITYRPFVEGAIRALVASISSPRDQVQYPAPSLPAPEPPGALPDPSALDKTPAKEGREGTEGEEAENNADEVDKKPQEGSSSDGLGGLWRGLFGDTGSGIKGQSEAQRGDAGPGRGESGGAPGDQGSAGAGSEQGLPRARSSSQRSGGVIPRASSSQMSLPEMSPPSGAYSTPPVEFRGAAEPVPWPGQAGVDPNASAWETVISHLLSDKERWILAALCILCGLLHNPSVEEDLLDEMGILPNHKRHRRMLVEALVDEKSSEEDLKRILQRPSASDSSDSSSSSASPLDSATAPSKGPSPAPGPDSPALLAQGSQGPCQVCGGVMPAASEDGVFARGQGGAGVQEGQGKGPRKAGSFWHEDLQNILSTATGAVAVQGQKLCSCSAPEQNHQQQKQQQQQQQQQPPDRQSRNGDIYFSPACRHPRRRRQVIDTVFQLFCRRPAPCPEALWHAAWLLRQLLPVDARLSPTHAHLLSHAYECARADMIVEMLDCWSDLLPGVLEHEWRACSKALESATLANDSALVLLPSLSPLLAEGDTSSAAYGERMRSVVKVFVVIQRMRCILLGLPLPESLSFCEAAPAASDARLWRKGLSLKLPQEGEEVSFAVGDALPCRVAFERGKEKKVLLLVASNGASGWILLAEGSLASSSSSSSSGRKSDKLLAQTAVAPSPGNEASGEDPALLTATVRVVAPLAGSQPTCDPKHKRWLHLRIRSPQQPPPDSGTLASRSPMGSRAQSKRLADGRWTLAFVDEQQCRRAQLAVMEEIYIQGNAVRSMLEPVLGGMPAFRLHRERSS